MNTKVCPRCGNERCINVEIDVELPCGELAPIDVLASSAMVPSAEIAKPEDDFDEARAKKWNEPDRSEAW